MKNYKLVKKLLNQRDLINFTLLLPILMISTLLEILGLSMVPILITTIIKPENTVTYLEKIFKDYELDLPNSFLNLNNQELILYFTGFFLIIFLLKNLILISIIFYENYISYNIKKNISYKLAKKYFFAPYLFHINTNSSSLITNLTHEIKLTAQFFKNHIIALREIIIIFAIVVTLLNLYFYATIISSVFFILISLLYYLFGKNFLYKVNQEGFKIRRKFLNFLQQGFGSIKTTLILQREGKIFNSLSKIIKNKEIYEFKNNFFNQTPKIYFEILCISTLSIIIFYSIYFEQNTNLFEILGTLSIALIRLMPAFNNLISNTMNIKSLSISANCIYKELIKLDDNTKEVSKKNFNKKVSIFGNIKFKNVSYYYPKTKKYIFKNLNLNIKNKGIIAVIGDSGSGKTTFVDLILGLIKPTNGYVYSNNHDINKVEHIWRQILGYVPQDIYLTDDTVKNNILLGLNNSKYNKRLFNLALKKSGTSNFINKLDNGINTNVGEHGIKLSGGQKQRIGIARALYKNPNIIVFDESTSSLDKENEILLMNDIKKISKEKMIIFITHKLENLKFADTVFKVKSGKILKIK